MPLLLPSALVEFILLGPLDDRRQLQDSPILGDVWVEFGKLPDKRLDLLIAPYRGSHSGTVAGAIDDGLKGDDDNAKIAFIQGLIVAQLTFEEVLRVVVPKTKWWLSRWKEVEDESPKKPKAKGKKTASKTEPPPRKKRHELEDYNVEKIKDTLKEILELADAWRNERSTKRVQDVSALNRFVALTGLILWAGKHSPTTENPDAIGLAISEALSHLGDIARLLIQVASEGLKDNVDEPMIWQVSLNRAAMPALARSVPAVKADAARDLFKVNCSEIAWAVIDSGIHGSHPAFQKPDGSGSRIKRSFDFKHFRKIVSLSNSKDKIREQNVKDLMEGASDMVNPPTDPDGDLKSLANYARNRGPIHWEIVERFVEIKPETEPQTNHGTHVAGIIGASKKAAELAAGKEDSDFADGMCPDIELYDFRVLGRDVKDTEFAIIAALQFIRHLNDRDNFLQIMGANLSLSIPHDVRNFACGRTPICDECERLVETGVVVVAAAGNQGYKSFETKEGSFDSYAAFSITDPGNADSILTVGATHRYWPHTYGVSFFSSRGPTGDGRLKPDLVAPGERIRAPLPKNDWGDLDGTSMAAPHVSGAAAMLMARYSEMIGQPRRIKRILCDSATDLGRERSFQGHGMLDVLRAFQSV
jgi:hypothetical protein